MFLDHCKSKNFLLIKPTCSSVGAKYQYKNNSFVGVPSFFHGFSVQDIHFKVNDKSEDFVMPRSRIPLDPRASYEV